MKLSYYIIIIIILCCIASLISVYFIDLNNNKTENKSNETDTTAWKVLSQQNIFVRTLPARAMEVVQGVVGTLRKEQRVIIVTPNGSLKGRTQAYKAGSTGFYYSFKGIRYGQPPVGPRRFKSALPEKSWRGVRNALTEGNTCPHRNMILDTYKGSEDCLFLNVYTPKLPNSRSHPKLPVMFWIHGGGFAFGSGNSFLYGPDFLVAEDVVLVTINYRLGALGFLSVGIGNAGLKDQVLALQWVQENIAAFGGDPSQVTVFGESAGAASVQYLMLSPLAVGLFHKGISESGSALNPWALAQNPIKRAFTLGRVLGFNTNNTNDLLEFLRTIPAKQIVDATQKTLTNADSRSNIGLPFVPSVDVYSNSNKDSKKNDLFEEEPFILDTPIKLIESGAFNPLPYITGFNANEAMLFMRRLRKDPTLLDVIENDFTRLVPLDIDLPGGRTGNEAELLAKRMKAFYIGQRPVSEETLEETINILTDLMFVRGIVSTARLHSSTRNATTYVYRFGFDGALGLYKRLLGINRPGVCHGDELGYLFHFGVFNLNLDPSSSEIQIKKKMVKMWTNFAKFSSPTPDGEEDPILAVKWKPVQPNNYENLNYMDITGILESKTNPDSERLKFWDDEYRKYNK